MYKDADSSLVCHGGKLKTVIPINRGLIFKIKICQQKQWAWFLHTYMTITPQVEEKLLMYWMYCLILIKKYLSSCIFVCTIYSYL